MKHGKRYRAALATIDINKSYGFDQAIEAIKAGASVSFDETVDVALKINIKKGVSVRNTLVLPHRFGSETRVLVFARGEKEKEAQDAGASYVGNDDLVAKIKAGWLDFDVAVATPDMMKDVGKLGQILGRRGLMPNPKTHTVTMDVASAIAELKKGRVEFRSDKTGVVHMPIGKVSMDAVQLTENLQTIVSEVIHRRPADHKGEFLQSISVSSTMGPGLFLSLEEITHV